MSKRKANPAKSRSYKRLSQIMQDRDKQLETYPYEMLRRIYIFYRIPRELDQSEQNEIKNCYEALAEANKKLRPGHDAAIREITEQLSALEKDELLSFSLELVERYMQLQYKLWSSKTCLTIKDDLHSSIKERQGKGRLSKDENAAVIEAYAKDSYYLYRSAGMSKEDARSTAMIDVGDTFTDKKGQPVRRGRTWICKNLRD